MAVSPMKRTPATTSVRRRVIAAEARHLQRIGDAAAGLVGQVLQVAIDVVMRHQRRIVLAQHAANLRLEAHALLSGRLNWRTRPRTRHRGIVPAEVNAESLCCVYRIHSCDTPTSSTR